MRIEHFGQHTTVDAQYFGARRLAGFEACRQAADLGVEIRRESIPLFPETKLLCDHFHLDILGLIASGALLYGIEPHDPATFAGAAAVLVLVGVLAGLVPALEARGWASAVMRPGRAPLRALDEGPRFFQPRAWSLRKAPVHYP